LNEQERCQSAYEQIEDLELLAAAAAADDDEEKEVHAAAGIDISLAATVDSTMVDPLVRMRKRRIAAAAVG
jgi:hypothetical protein